MGSVIFPVQKSQRWLWGAASRKIVCWLICTSSDKRQDSIRGYAQCPAGLGARSVCPCVCFVEDLVLQLKHSQFL